MFRFSFQKAFVGVVKETDDLAGQHELIVESLTEKVYKEFHLLHNELKTERRKVGFRVIFPGDVVIRFLKSWLNHFHVSPIERGLAGFPQFGKIIVAMSNRALKKPQG